MDKKVQQLIDFKNKLPTAYVIGGAGFIGSYVCESLAAQNANVIAIDDFSSGKEANLEKLKPLSNFVLLNLNINDGFDPEWPKADYVFHIGGIEAYLNGVDLSLNTMLVNSIGTFNSLEFAKKHKSKYLLVSSLDVYNGALSSLDLKKYFGVSERDAKRYTHHEAKRYAEALTTEYYRKFDLDVRIIRIAETYGPRMDLESGNEIAKLISDAIYSDTLGVSGDGLKIIHPTFVSDITAGITKAMFSNNTSGKIYNLATPEELNVLNFAYVIQKNSTKPLKIQFTQEFKEIKFPLHKIELTQSQEDLSWTPKTKLEEGITQTLEYFFLNRDKIKNNEIKGEAEIKEKIPNTSYIPQRIGTTNAPKKTLIIKNPKSKKLSKANVVILSASLFVILLMFVFPVTGLYYFSRTAFSDSLLAIKSINQNESTPLSQIVEAQRQINLAHTQFENIEWFFNMARQRSRLEGSRAALSTTDKVMGGLAAYISNRNESATLTSAILNGKTKPEDIENHNRKLNDSLLSFENALLENEAANDTIYSTTEKNSLQSIVTLTKLLMTKIKTELPREENTRQYLVPAQPKYFAVVFLDNSVSNSLGGNIYGYALLTTGPHGVQELKTFPYNKKNEFKSLVSDIKENAESSNYGTIEAVLLANDKVRNELIANLSTVPNEEYAEVITAKNVEQKITEHSSTNEYKTAIWSSIWKNIKSTKEIDKISHSIQSSIDNEEIRIVTIKANGDITYPQCGEENILQEKFGTVTRIVEQPYCIRASIETNAKGIQETAENMEIKVSTTEQTAKLTKAIENQTDEEHIIKIKMQLPGKPKLINVTAPFPISFDKIKATQDEATTYWEYEAKLQSKAKEEIMFEWQVNLSDGNLESQGVYLEKQYGAHISTVSAQLSSSDNKTTSKKVSNSDLYLEPPRQ